MNYDIVGLGLNAIDYLGVAPEYPPLDIKIELDELKIQGGGVPVLIDAGSLRPGVPELLEHVDAVVASHRFAQEYTGETDPMKAARIMHNGRTRVSIVTQGEKGSACVASDGEFYGPAFEVDVVDTTGAGDVFHGAFSFGLAKGWDVRTIVTFASAVAAIKCTKVGGRQGIPSLGQTLTFLADRGYQIPQVGA